MLYTVEQTPDRKWAVLNTRTKAPYGDPLDSMEAAMNLVREAEAQAAIACVAPRAGPAGSPFACFAAHRRPRGASSARA